MRKSLMTIGFIAAAFAATPSVAQTLEIGRDGVRVVQPELRPEMRPDPRRDRREIVDRREISERDAVRIARGEGLREVDDVRSTRSTYRVGGVDRSGNDILVSIDRRSGEVLSVR